MSEPRRTGRKSKVKLVRGLPASQKGLGLWETNKPCRALRSLWGAWSNTHTLRLGGSVLSSRDPGFRQPAQGSVHFLGPGGLVRVTPKWGVGHGLLWVPSSAPQEGCL